MGTSRSASVGQGLAQLSAGIGTLITFATSPENVQLIGAHTSNGYWTTT